MGRVFDVTLRLHASRTGSELTGVIEFAVNPARDPSVACALITAIPVGYRPSALRNSRDVILISVKPFAMLETRRGVVGLAEIVFAQRGRRLIQILVQRMYAHIPEQSRHWGVGPERA